ncbi:MAG TPA: hypothetical protein VLA19_09710 [Herpetosiphonaceae bacterium]|nr:hypothetical protein [Herpetosiphonaceae bacterium]
MSGKTPRVWGQYLEDPAQPGRDIQLDTEAWVEWLEAPATTSFSYPVFDPSVGYILGFITVRKEQRQRGGSYWSVYRRERGRVRKIYLGRSTMVTRERLEATAAMLRDGPTPA